MTPRNLPLSDIGQMANRLAGVRRIQKGQGRSLIGWQVCKRVSLSTKGIIVSSVGGKSAILPEKGWGGKVPMADDEPGARLISGGSNLRRGAP